VRWQDCMSSAVERGVSVVLELGPGRSLSRMFNDLDESVESRSVEDFRTLEGVAKWVNARSEPHA
jgi:[acyl-carrier-protein] S-malonyltransferase